MPTRKISLQGRFVVALLLVFLLALAALAFISQRIVVPGLLSEEKEDAQTTLLRVRQAITRELDHVNLLAKDWATWDDSYAFVTGERSSYVAANFSRLTLEDIQLIMIAVTDQQQHIVWIAGIDPATDTYTSCPTATAECAWAAPLMSALQHTAPDRVVPLAAGTLLVMPDLYLAGQRPILKTDGSGPPVGTMTMIRAMDAAWLAQLVKETGVDLKLSATLSPAHTDHPIELTRLDDQRLRTRMWLDALPTGYRLQLQAQLPREHFRGAMHIYNFSMLWTAGLLLVVMLVIIGLLRRMILKPMAELAIYAQKHRQNNGYLFNPDKLLHRRDELGIMAQEFKHLIEHLDQRSADLFDLSYRDALTGLGNRRLLDERLADTLVSHHRLGQPVALISIDVDYFKAFNDHYGHPAGDRCLRQLAATLRQHFQDESYLVIRVGGEEFTIVLPAVDKQRAIAYATNICNTVEALGIEHAHSSISSVVTISAGVAVSTLSRPLDADALIAAGDQALYQAKHHGRNSVSSVEAQGERTSAQRR